MREREQWIGERKDLHDRILALSNPLSLREVRRTPQGESPAPATTRSFTYPRPEVLVRPPYPPKLETPPTDGEDNEGAA